MAKLTNVRVRVTHQESVMAPGELTLLNDQSWIVLGVSAPPQKVAEDSYLKIFVGDSKHPQLSWSLDEIMLMYRRGGASFDAYLPEVLEALRAGWQRLAREWPLTTDIATELEETRIALQLWKNALNDMGLHILRVPRAITVPPRQPIRLRIEPEPEQPILVRLSGLRSIDLGEM